jgi:hypothetical protein
MHSKPYLRLLAMTALSFDNHAVNPGVRFSWQGRRTSLSDDDRPALKSKFPAGCPS